jgi:hypothetical protein
MELLDVFGPVGYAEPLQRRRWVEHQQEDRVGHDLRTRTGGDYAEVQTAEQEEHGYGGCT